MGGPLRVSKMRNTRKVGPTLSGRQRDCHQKDRRQAEEAGRTGPPRDWADS